MEQATPCGRFGYIAAGPASAPPLVFLHGIGGAARCFAAQVAHFAPRFHAVAWDMPGYGASEPLGVVSIESLAMALAMFIETLGLDRPVLAGHSIGGMIVQRYIGAKPDGARAIVLAQTSPAFGRPDGDWQREFIQARLGPLDAGRTMAELAEGMVAGLVGEGADPDGVALARDCMARTPESTYRDTVLALPGFDQREALGRIAVPTLVLAGTRDANAPADMMERMAACIPGADYVALDGVGHLANLERPGEFNAALDRFLQGRGIG